MTSIFTTWPRVDTLKCTYHRGSVDTMWTFCDLSLLNIQDTHLEAIWWRCDEWLTDLKMTSLYKHAAGNQYAGFQWLSPSLKTAWPSVQFVNHSVFELLTARWPWSCLLNFWAQNGKTVYTYHWYWGLCWGNLCIKLELSAIVCSWIREGMKQHNAPPPLMGRGHNK